MQYPDRYKELLHELVESRRFLMSQLADLAEENDDRYLAMAWRWMRDTRRWPSCGKRGFGWATTARCVGLVRTGKMLSMLLPQDLQNLGLMVITDRWTEESDALLRAADAIAAYMRQRERAGMPI